MRPVVTRTSLARHVAPGRTNAEQAVALRRLKAERWRLHGDLVVNVDTDLTDDWERQVLVNVGNRLYGPRVREAGR